ncbi:MAG TPA: ATP-dependent DNA helicase RecG [Nitrospirae bacterium]|nr:ATP-dependent DNA helicase RecG [Nitrospirota bacterium]HDK16622.1 ATP-dependent DNA helicase RecG [Nitrospirota bacterium]HDK81888.1 ATP-dependent DNA helicase RecG [Nitrospirota bacterium]
MMLTLKPKKMSKPDDAGSVKTSRARPALSGDTPVQYVKGVGPRRAQLLERLGIKTLEDILHYFPWRYEDRKNLKKISDLTYGSLETTAGQVVSSKIISTRRRGMKIFELLVTDNTGFLRCKWFNQPYMEKYFSKGQQVILSGTVKGMPSLRAGAKLVSLSSEFEMENPDFEHLENGDKFVHTSRIVPVYRATEGFTPKQLRTLMFNTVKAHSSVIKEYMPAEVLERNGLMSLSRAIEEIHFPEEVDDAGALNRGKSPAHRRLVFDEFFLLELGLALMKKKEVLEKGICFQDDGQMVKRFIKELPFKLTNAQKRVFDQIRDDMKRDAPMNRLVHGDVGCGKTIVALLSMLVAVDNGYQSCMMAPTELLAEQHYINIHRMVEPIGLNVVLLTSGSKAKPIEEISGGRAHIIIGTHSLIQEQLKFKKLGLAVIDEQHKFGVVQRANLRKKGFNPDILIMTATPIPRTLALTLYGDLDISLIDELPSGRKPVTTKVFFPSQKDRVYEQMNKELSKGRQIYIVYPLIEGSEKLDLKNAVEGAEAFKKIFPSKRISLVHGKIRQEEREVIMDSFKAGDVDLLVATTVIEVGVDVPNASVMLIVHAERFGLAQLHQLRGRIGRGGYESYCMLMAYPPFSEEARRRLKATESTSDGFKIAEEDLEIRGPGEFFGTRQSGIPDLKVANIIRDVKVLEAARKDAFALVDAIALKDHPLLGNALQRKWQGRLELIKS